MNEIMTTATFQEYLFCRVKPTNDGIVYVPKEWIGKEVSIIPMPYTISEKVIEKECKTSDGYIITVPTIQIMSKTIGKGKNVGYMYLPKEWVGLDVLIIKLPNYAELF